MRELGSFRVFGSWDERRYGKLGLFRIFWSSTSPSWLRLALFRIMEVASGAKLGLFRGIGVARKCGIRILKFLARNVMRLLVGHGLLLPLFLVLLCP